MVEIFITNIQRVTQSESVLRAIQCENIESKINFDFGQNNFPFPCGHTILRVEGEEIDRDRILVLVRNQGYRCDILEDKICV